MPDKKTSRQIALERIQILVDQALKVYPESWPFAQRYLDLARRISMKYKVPLPQLGKMLLCRGCGKLILPGVNSRVRLQKRREPHLVITCLECGHIKRRPLKDRLG